MLDGPKDRKDGGSGYSTADEPVYTDPEHIEEGEWPEMRAEHVPKGVSNLRLQEQCDEESSDYERVSQSCAECV